MAHNNAVRSEIHEQETVLQEYAQIVMNAIIDYMGLRDVWYAGIDTPPTELRIPSARSIRDALTAESERHQSDVSSGAIERIPLSGKSPLSACTI